MTGRVEVVIRTDVPPITDRCPSLWATLPFERLERGLRIMEPGITQRTTDLTTRNNEM